MKLSNLERVIELVAERRSIGERLWRLRNVQQTKVMVLLPETRITLDNACYSDFPAEVFTINVGEDETKLMRDRDAELTQIANRLDHELNALGVECDSPVSAPVVLVPDDATLEPAQE